MTTNIVRAEISALTTHCLTSLTSTIASHHGDRQQAATAVDEQVEMLLQLAYQRYQWDGIFEIAHACATVMTDGVVPTVGLNWRFGGTTPSNADPVADLIGPPPPQTVAEYAATELITAVVHGDDQKARAAFDRCQVDQSTPHPEAACVALMALMVSHAVGRYNGRGLQLTSMAGTRWPPVCDFCIGTTARWMFYCHGFDLPVPDQLGGLSIRIEDSEFWYACSFCRPHIEADPPRWSIVLRRHLKTRPQAVNDPMVMFLAFQHHRISATAVPLPATRPLNTPEKLRAQAAARAAAEDQSLLST